MSEQTIAAALSAASESDKAEFAHYLARHALPGVGDAEVRAIVAAFDRFTAERLKDR